MTINNKTGYLGTEWYAQQEADSTGGQGEGSLVLPQCVGEYVGDGGDDRFHHGELATQGGHRVYFNVYTQLSDISCYLIQILMVVRYFMLTYTVFSDISFHILLRAVSKKKNKSLIQ